jgi:uncharacterized tellurite resistance protein B-like protein
MSIASFAGVLKLFGGSNPSAEEQAELAKEVMLLILARATAADTNIKAIEVDKVREVLLARTGEDFSDADIRVSANSSLYENAPLTKYLASATKTLLANDRTDIAQALAEVINADGRVSDREVVFFNDVANAMSLTPAQLAGINAE